MNRPHADIALRRDESVPVYRDLYQRMRSEILSGRLAAGDRLPSSRTLASQLGVARGTVEAAYQMLAGEGYTIGEGARGTIVNPALPRNEKPVVIRDGRRARSGTGREHTHPAGADAVPNGAAGARRVPAQAMGANRHAGRTTTRFRANGLSGPPRSDGLRAAATRHCELSADRTRYFMHRRANSSLRRASRERSPWSLRRCSSRTTRCGSRDPGYFQAHWLLRQAPLRLGGRAG